MEKFNVETPANVPRVEVLSAKRREKAAKYLKAFPDEAWWSRVFLEYHASPLLSGQRPPGEGHANWKPDFDWLLSAGRNNGTENCVKVYEGKYRQGQGWPELPAKTRRTLEAGASFLRAKKDTLL